MKKFLISVSIIFILTIFISPCMAANDYDGNPYILDTAEDIDGAIEVQKIEFIPEATNDDLYVEDFLGNQLIKVRASGAAPNYEADEIITRDFDPPVEYRGVYLKIIDGGVLKIYKTKRSP